jgi:hypothetical protein
LVVIVTEAREEGRSTVVFSYFRDVLDTVAAALAAPGVSVHGPLTGDVPVAERMGLVDAFTADDAGAVLVAQVAVGGTGLNLQAASVVVLCEPQLTPAAEAQAVARLHRMGQVRTVQAHLLLAEDGVDERIVELLAGKQQVFDDYVRRSSVAAAAVSAVDVTEAGLARDVVAWEQARLGYAPVWDGLGEEPGGATTVAPPDGGSVLCGQRLCVDISAKWSIAARIFGACHAWLRRARVTGVRTPAATRVSMALRAARSDTSRWDAA